MSEQLDKLEHQRAAFTWHPIDTENTTMSFHFTIQFTIIVFLNEILQDYELATGWTVQSTGIGMV